MKSDVLAILKWNSYNTRKNRDKIFSDVEIYLHFISLIINLLNKMYSKIYFQMYTMHSLKTGLFFVGKTGDSIY